MWDAISRWYKSLFKNSSDQNSIDDLGDNWSFRSKDENRNDLDSSFTSSLFNKIFGRNDESEYSETDTTSQSDSTYQEPDDAYNVRRDSPHNYSEPQKRDTPFVEIETFEEMDHTNSDTGIWAEDHNSDKPSYYSDHSSETDISSIYESAIEDEENYQADDLGTVKERIKKINSLFEDEKTPNNPRPKIRTGKVDTLEDTKKKLLSTHSI